MVAVCELLSTTSAVACRGAAAASCAKVLLEVSEATKKKSLYERVAERLLASQQVQADALVFAFTRANKCKTLHISLLHMLHNGLRMASPSYREDLDLFYETWRLEHVACTKGRCPIPEYHDWACQMRGQQLQDNDDAFGSNF